MDHHCVLYFPFSLSIQIVLPLARNVAIKKLQVLSDEWCAVNSGT